LLGARENAKFWAVALPNGLLVLQAFLIYFCF